MSSIDVLAPKFKKTVFWRPAVEADAEAEVDAAEDDAAAKAEEEDTTLS